MGPTLQLGSKMAVLVIALPLVGSAGAQQPAPTTPAAVPQIHKMIIYNGPVPTVSYSVEGGSPHLQALGKAAQFTENEINLTNELQKLRLGIVANEQTLDNLRVSQQLGLGPISTPGSAPCYAPSDSALKRSLIPGLAQEATPATAFQLINLWERLQTEMKTEQGKAPAVVSGAPGMQNAQPVAPATGLVSVPPAPAPVSSLTAAPITVPGMVPAQAVAKQPLMPQDARAFEQTVRQNQETIRQQILQMQQQIRQRYPQLVQLH